MAHTAAPALDADDRVALGDNAELQAVVDGPLQTAVDILLPDLDVEVGLLLGEVERPHTAVQVRVLSSLVSARSSTRSQWEIVVTYPSGGLVAGDHNDGADGAVLGQQAGSVATGCSSAFRSLKGSTAPHSRHIPGGQNDNGAGVQLQAGTDGSHGNRLGGRGRAGAQVAQLVEDAEVGDGNLSQQAGLAHHLDSLARVATLGGLTRQHDTVGTVQDGVGNIGNLGTGRARVGGHALQHLSGADDL